MELWVINVYFAEKSYRLTYVTEENYIKARGIISKALALNLSLFLRDDFSAVVDLPAKSFRATGGKFDDIELKGVIRG